MIRGAGGGKSSGLEFPLVRVKREAFEVLSVLLAWHHEWIMGDSGAKSYCVGIQAGDRAYDSSKLACTLCTIYGRWFRLLAWCDCTSASTFIITPFGGVD